MDSTEFVVPKKLKELFPGYGGAGREAIAQIQFEFEILSKSITQLKIGNALDSDVREGLSHLASIPARTLLLRDQGYYNIDAYKQIEKHDLYYISRLNTQVNIYVKEKDKFVQLTLSKLLKKLPKNRNIFIDIQVYIGKDYKYPVRLIASRLSPEDRNKRLKKIRKNKGNKLSELHKISCNMNVFVTNISDRLCKAEQLYNLYKVRWQIELIFKTWKSILNIDHYHSMNINRFMSYLIIKLLWVILNWNLVNLLDIKKNTELSYYKISDTIKQQSYRLRDILTKQKEKFKAWLKNLYDLCHKYNVKEDKKGRKKLSEILRAKLDDSGNENYFYSKSNATLCGIKK